MERFIGVEIKDRPQVPRVSSLSAPLWKKSSAVFTMPRKGPGSGNSVPLVQSTPKLSPVHPASYSLLPAVFWPAPHCCTLGCAWIPRLEPTLVPSWPPGPHG